MFYTPLLYSHAHHFNNLKLFTAGLPRLVTVLLELDKCCLQGFSERSVTAHILNAIKSS